MPSCIVKWCRNNSTKDKKHSGISYYIIPKNPIRREKLIKAVRLERGEPNWIPSRSSKICSIHFEEDETYRSKKGRYNKLRETAVPVCTMVNSLPSSRSVLKISSACNRENFLQPDNYLPFPRKIVCSSINESIKDEETCLASNDENVLVELYHCHTKSCWRVSAHQEKVHKKKYQSIRKTY